MRVHPLYKNEPKAAFGIQCDGCTLPAVWLSDIFVPEVLRKKKERVRILAVLGYHTPAGPDNSNPNIKYLPARKGNDWAVASGLTGPGRKLLVPSSGNFIASAHDDAQKRRIEADLIGVVSSTLPAGKRDALERRKISLLTEIDLMRELGRSEPQETFEMLREYSHRTEIPILDQYGCDQADDGWNRASYMPIAEEVAAQTGGQVSLFVSTVGTKGKYGIGVELQRKNEKTALVAAFPYPGDGFPGGRDEEQILQVKNPYGVDPIRRSTDHLVAYYWSATLSLAGIPAGITFGAELGTARHVLLEMFRDDRLDEIRCEDGSIVVLLVCSDTIIPYIDDGKRWFPHLYDQIADLYT